MKILISLIFLNFLSFISSTNCPKFSCQKLAEGQCISMEYNATTMDRLIKVNPCEEDNNFCKIDSYLFNGTSNSVSNCIKLTDLKKAIKR